MKPPEDHQNHHLEECRHLFSSLVLSINSVRSFHGRWATVSSTLARLRQSVEEIAVLPKHELSDDLFCALSETLTLTLSISEQCRCLNPPSGRLRTQSDLASASAFLSQHASDADFLLLRSPDSFSIVTRLQIGAVESRIPALDSLISKLDGKNAMVTAAAKGLIPALVRLLDRASLSSPEAREKAVSAISRISSFEICRHLLIAEAAPLVIHLSRVLVEPEAGRSAKKNACSVLEAFALQRDIAMTVGSGGNISALLEICRGGAPSAQAAAAGVLKNLSDVPELRLSLIAENAAGVLVGVLRSGTAPAQENAASCLANLTEGANREGVKLGITQQGVLDCIRDYWEAAAADGRNLYPVIKLLRNLSFSDIVFSNGFLRRVILSLDVSSARTRTEAAKAVSELSQGCTGKEELEGAVPLLVKMLEAKEAEEKEAAVMALASLMPFAACRRAMKKDERGIHNLIFLLDHCSPCGVEKKRILEVLLAVAQSRRCRKLMVASGARGFLLRLQDMRVEGAKKLSDLLAKGKLLGVFPRT